MKRILYFEIVDIGIRNGMGTPRGEMLDAIENPILFNGYTAGFGTDAESALDDMLHLMQEQDYDITGLEGQIKEDWEPGQDEGDGDCYYHFGIIFKYQEN
jgi:hypothetical protein